MSQFIVPQTTTYPVNHPRQKAITEAIISDLIINCNMPLSITDNKHFIHFLSIMDTKYTAVSRRTITSRLDTVVSERQSKLISEMATVENLSVTVDIWSDRRMRGYLGVTAHWMNTAADAITLKSHLLACNRFKGSHTGERICEEFEQICDQYKIKQKIDHIICDNAANMKKAFTTCFPSSAEADEDDDDCLDDGELWNFQWMRRRGWMRHWPPKVSIDYNALRTHYNWLLVMVLKRPGLSVRLWPKCRVSVLCSTQVLLLRRNLRKNLANVEFLLLLLLDGIRLSDSWSPCLVVTTKLCARSWMLEGTERLF